MLAAIVQTTTNGNAAAMLQIGLWLWILFAVLFGGAGAAMAYSRDSSIAMGFLLGLMCGVFGLFFVNRLPQSATLKEKRRRPVSPIAAGVGLDDGSPISPEVARKLGLPPQKGTVGGVSPAQWGQAPAQSGPLPPPAPAGRWATDPSGRFAERLWDGAQWTPRVRNADGSESIDPPTR